MKYKIQNLISKTIVFKSNIRMNSEQDLNHRLINVSLFFCLKKKKKEKRVHDGVGRI